MVVDYDYIIEAERETAWDATSVEVGYRQWSYQMCSSIGWFHTSGAFPDQPFGNRFPVDVYHAGCAAVFGDAYVRFQECSEQENDFFFRFEKKGSQKNDSNAIPEDLTRCMVA